MPDLFVSKTRPEIDSPSTGSLCRCVFHVPLLTLSSSSTYKVSDKASTVARAETHGGQTFQDKESLWEVPDKEARVRRRHTSRGVVMSVYRIDNRFSPTAFSFGWML